MMATKCHILVNGLPLCGPRVFRRAEALDTLDARVLKDRATYCGVCLNAARLIRRKTAKPNPQET